MIFPYKTPAPIVTLRVHPRSPAQREVQHCRHWGSFVAWPGGFFGWNSWVDLWILHGKTWENYGKVIDLWIDWWILYMANDESMVDKLYINAVWSPNLAMCGQLSNIVANSQVLECVPWPSLDTLRSHLDLLRSHRWSSHRWPRPGILRLLSISCISFRQWLSRFWMFLDVFGWFWIILDHIRSFQFIGSSRWWVQLGAQTPPGLNVALQA